MLLMGEGALAEIVLLTPRGAYEKADRITNACGETVVSVLLSPAREISG